MDRRPRIARETRRLFQIVGVSLAVLWVLARVRFPDRPPAANPVAPVLAQLGAEPPLDSIAASVEELRARVAPLLNPVAWRSDDGASTVRGALRFRDDLALTIAPANSSASGTAGVVAADRGTRLSIVRTGSPSPTLRVWTRPTDGSVQYMFATDMSSGALFLQPTFVGPFTPLRKPVWRDPLWALPQRAAVDGAFLFAADGSLAGVAIVDADGHALVPADTLLAAASELADRNGTTCADIGITVQALTPALQAAIGTAAALGVAWVNPDGPAASQLTVGDALDRVNDQPVRSIQEWQSMMDRIAPGDPVRMQLLRGGTRVDVTVTSVAGRPAAHEHPLGLATRRVSGSGVEILRVEAGSAGERAGLRAGDILTRIGNTSSPTPRDVAREFATSGEGPLVAAVTRGNAHLLVALEKTW